MTDGFVQEVDGEDRTQGRREEEAEAGERQHADGEGAGGEEVEETLLAGPSWPGLFRGRFHRRAKLPSIGMLRAALMIGSMCVPP